MQDISNVVIERLTRMETKLDTALFTLGDHEDRIRTVEQKKENCQQTTALKEFKDTLEDHNTRIGNLEKSHDMDEGAQTAKRTTLEYVLALVTILELLIILYQAIKGL